MGERGASAVLTLRVPEALNKGLAREARRRRRTKSQVARDILASALEARPGDDPEQEARRQSLLVSGRDSEKDTLGFISQVADRRGWK
jgi:hypothetical protein